jgi:hypothetical protein
MFAVCVVVCEGEEGKAEVQIMRLLERRSTGRVQIWETREREANLDRPYKYRNGVLIRFYPTMRTWGDLSA